MSKSKMLASEETVGLKERQPRMGQNSERRGRGRAETPRVGTFQGGPQAAEPSRGSQPAKVAATAMESGKGPKPSLKSISARESKSAKEPRPSRTPQKGEGFTGLGISKAMLATLAERQFNTPTDIQRELIPHALAGVDCLGQAKTGTGKTAAFAIPMLERIRPGVGVQALVLVPTRELAVQVGDHIDALGVRHPLKTLLLYGGTKVHQNVQHLSKDPDVIVGTPGRVLDLMGRRALDLSTVKLVVLDEVDRMLDIGFRDDIRRILSHVKGEHQTIFVSATIDDAIRRLARTFMHEPMEINVSSDRLTVEHNRQEFVTVEPEEKFELLRDFIRHEKPQLVIVFTRTKRGAQNVSKKLRHLGVNCEEIHGDLMQGRRDRVLKALREGSFQVLVATDLASRGLDVMEVSHVVNYDIPEDPSVYVHRVGRTARMGHDGCALTFATREQGREITEIEKLINRELIPFERPWLKLRKSASHPHAAPIKPHTSTMRQLAAAPPLQEALKAAAPASGVRTLGSRFRGTPRRRSR